MFALFVLYFCHNQGINKEIYKVIYGAKKTFDTRKVFTILFYSGKYLVKYLKAE